MQDLIELGAQTVLIPGNLPIGCSAAFLTIYYGSSDEEYDSTTGCLIRLNKFAEYHNELLQSELNRIRELHPNVNIIYGDYYNAAMQFFRSPDDFGTRKFHSLELYINEIVLNFILACVVMHLTIPVMANGSGLLQVFQMEL